MLEEFVPLLYLKKGCPFCFKVRVALLEADLLDRVNIREFASGTPEEEEIKNDLSLELDKLSFPAAEVAPGEFKKDSDELIAYFTGLNGADVRDLPTLQAYKDGPFSELMRLIKENRELKQSQRA